jgi:hypothetical protein
MLLLRGALASKKKLALARSNGKMKMPERSKTFKLTLIWAAGGVYDF